MHQRLAYEALPSFFTAAELVVVVGLLVFKRYRPSSYSDKRGWTETELSEAELPSSKSRARLTCRELMLDGVPHTQALKNTQQHCDVHQIGVTTA